MQNMTVAELIAELEAIQDKTHVVYVAEPDGQNYHPAKGVMAGQWCEAHKDVYDLEQSYIAELGPDECMVPCVVVFP
jgi:hypothetical protein